MTVDLPPEYQKAGRVVDVKHEEEAICWLWASYSLLPWNSPIAWLYTPVVGSARWPGDLWGVDIHGNLLIMEAKRSNRNDDAFADVVAFHLDRREELSALHWKQKWAIHLKAELAFPDGTSERPKGQTDGILPRSNKRCHIRRWPELAETIDRNIRSATYPVTVLKYLATRARHSDPSPYYIALMVESDRQLRVIGNASLASAGALRRIAGKNHVVAVSISCEHTQSNRGRIVANLVSLPEAASVSGSV